MIPAPFTVGDPFAAARLRATAHIIRSERDLTRKITAAMDRWLEGAVKAIYGRPNALSLIADAGDVTTGTGAAGESLPNLNLWPDLGSWQVMIDTVVLPEITKLFGDAFIKATREADIQDAPYSQAYIAIVHDRLSRNLWPNDVFDDVREVIGDGIAEGLSIDNITKNLRSVLQVDHYAWEARRIARTETMGAVNGGQWNGASAYAELTGETMFKQWFATMDTRVRLDHSRAHQQVVPIQTDFVVGGYMMAYPAAPDGPASEVCNCRCALLILDEQEASAYIDVGDWSGDDGEQGPDENLQDILTEAGVSDAATTISPDDLGVSVTGSTATFAGSAPTIAPGAPPVVQAPGDTAPDGTDGRYWWGILAPLDTDSADGRVISAPDGGDPRTRPLPVPILYQDTLAPAHDGAFQVGLIRAVGVKNGNLYGAGTFDMEDPRAAGIARKVKSGNAGWISVDLDDTTMEFEAAADGDEERGRVVASDWRLMSATLVNQPAFPEAKIQTGRPGDYFPELDKALDDSDIGAHSAYDPETYQMCTDRRCERCTTFLSTVFGLCVDQDCTTCKTGGWHAPPATVAAATPWPFTCCDNCVVCATGHEHVYGGRFACCQDADCEMCPEYGAPCDDPECEYCGNHTGAAADGDQAAGAGAHANQDGQCEPDCADCALDAYACDDPECGECRAVAAAVALGKTVPHKGSTGPAKPSGKRHAHTSKHGKNKGRRTLSVPATSVRRPTKPATKPTAPATRTAAPTAGMSIREGGAMRFTVLHPDTGLPVADRNAAWDSGAAAKRVADYARTNGALDPAKYGKAFLYRDAGADAATAAAYKLGYADIVNGRLTIIPKGVFAVAGALQGARTPLQVPSAERAGLRSAVERLYGRLASALKDDTIKAPWKDDEKTAAHGAVTFAALTAAGVFAPPVAWFDDPRLDGPTGTIVTDEGRTYGHIAAWGTCHTGIPGKCVKPPKSKSGYAYFHLGLVRTAEGEDVPVGTLHFGTDHADTRASVKLHDAQRHYADTGCAAAVVRVGEDKHGIWFAGAVLPGLDDAGLATLRHAPLSGDWRQVAGALELVGALCVNQPGFPIPRTKWSTDEGQQVFALCAAGAIQPAPVGGQCSCDVCPAPVDDEVPGPDEARAEFARLMAPLVADELRGDAARVRDARATAAMNSLSGGRSGAAAPSDSGTRRDRLARAAATLRKGV